MLTTICSSSAGQDPFDREQIQAWLLITVYELMRSLHRQAWMSVGRAFRLVQLLRLHELDSRSNVIDPADEGFVEKEEERRAFWLAYFLDHLFGISSNWPITLNELVVSLELCTLHTYEPPLRNQ
jgi:Fungal specific transcription factor domain